MGAQLFSSDFLLRSWEGYFSKIYLKQRLREFLEKNVAYYYCQIYAELQLPSPLVPTREVYFLRYSKRVDHLWVVVDVSVDSLRGNPPPSLLRCRKRPSGCVIEETSNGYSKVNHYTLWCMLGVGTCGLGYVHSSTVFVLYNVFRCQLMGWAFSWDCT